MPQITCMELRAVASGQCSGTPRARSATGRAKPIVGRADRIASVESSFSLPRAAAAWSLRLADTPGARETTDGYPECARMASASGRVSFDT